MKVKFKDIEPAPPQREVVITLAVVDAKKLREELCRMQVSCPTQHYTVNRLINALEEAHVQNT